MYLLPRWYSHARTNGRRPDAKNGEPRCEDGSLLTVRPTHDAKLRNNNGPSLMLAYKNANAYEKNGR